MKSLILFSLLSMSLTAQAGTVCGSLESSYRLELTKLSGSMSEGVLSMAGYDLLPMLCHSANMNGGLKCVADDLTNTLGFRATISKDGKTAVITQRKKIVAELSCR